MLCDDRQERGIGERLAALPWRHTLALALGFFLLVGGWMGRNSYRYGKFTLSAISDINLFYFSAASLEAHRQGISLEEAQDQLRARLAEMPEPENNRWPYQNHAAIGREVILAHPVQFAWYNAVDALNGLRPGFSFLLALRGHQGGAGDPMEVFRSSPIDLGAILAALSAQDPGILLLEGAMVLYEAAVVGLGLMGLVILGVRRDWRAELLLGVIPAVLMYLPEVNARSIRR
jgi:hypothetical protein